MPRTIKGLWKEKKHGIVIKESPYSKKERLLISAHLIEMNGANIYEAVQKFGLDGQALAGLLNDWMSKAKRLHAQGKPPAPN